MSIAQRAFRAAVIFAAVVGIVAAIMRTVIVARMTSLPADRRPELSAYDARALTFFMWAAEFPPGSPGYVGTRRNMVRVSNKYLKYSRITYAHMIPGILILVLAPFQFNRALRNRNRRLHRWTGRAILVLVLLSSFSAIFFGVLDRQAPPFERPTVALITALFLFAAVRAFVAIRRRDIALHREWMIRMLAIAVGIGTVRIVGVGIAYFVRATWDTQFVLAMWMGWLLSMGAAELWIRHTRPSVVSGREPAVAA